MVPRLRSRASTTFIHAVLGLRFALPGAPRPSGQLLRQRHKVSVETLRRPCGLLSRQRQTLVSVFRAVSWRILTLVFSTACFPAVPSVSGEVAHDACHYGHSAENNAVRRDLVFDQRLADGTFFWGGASSGRSRLMENLAPLPWLLVYALVVLCKCPWPLRRSREMAVASSARLAFSLRGTQTLSLWSLYSDSPLISRPQPLGSGGDATPCEDTKEDFGPH